MWSRQLLESEVFPVNSRRDAQKCGHCKKTRFPMSVISGAMLAESNVCYRCTDRGPVISKGIKFLEWWFITLQIGKVFKLRR